MKILDKIAIIIFNLCLLLAAGITPALLLASSPEYYYEQFEKNGIYASVDKRQKIYARNNARRATKLLKLIF